MPIVSELRDLIKLLQENPVGFYLAVSVTLISLVIYHLLASSYWFASANTMKTASRDIAMLSSQIDDIERKRSKNYSYTAASLDQTLAHLEYNLEAIELLEEACDSTERYSTSAPLPQDLRTFALKCKDYRKYAEANKQRLSTAIREIYSVAKRLKELSHEDEGTSEVVSAGIQGVAR